MKKLLISLAILVYLFSLAIAISIVFSGGFAFWYDPARDFLLASDNLKKLTLIGPTSGIPGIFYGPYWIWLLSFGLLFSMDPRHVIFIVLTLPYFIVLPFIFWKLKNIFGMLTIILIWIMFILGPGMQYATNPWNPYPAPLLFAVLIYLLITIDYAKFTKLLLIKLLAAGLLSGLILNFHISFGLGVTVGSTLFLFIYLFFVERKFKSTHIIQNMLLIMVFGVGVVITFLPFLAFEMRHGFNQIQTALSVFTTKGAVVGVQGLSDLQIIQQFFETFATLIKMPLQIAVLILTIGIGGFIYTKKKTKKHLLPIEKKLLLVVTIVSVTVLTLYLTSKNPVWNYHFIGVEILFIFLLAILAAKVRYFLIGLSVWVFVSLSLQMPTYIRSFQDNRLSNPTLANKQYIVTLIKDDAKDGNYAIFAYSPPIYIYDYSYLFKWLAKKDISYDPGNNPKNADVVYVISPQKKDAKVQDFINSNTPSSRYKTVKSWNIPDGTTVLKQVKLQQSEM